MTVATELQNIVSDLSVAIAGRKSFGRCELEALRRRLDLSARELRRDDRADAVARQVLTELCASIDGGVADLAGFAHHARLRANLDAG